ncbi:hypothetical protein EVAR_6571_1 [Eumeta japonica]|uniref:Uncharacterized protein n=1 Tax=Eumeta variegata TaxID=151549 RepID=A0A4C1SQ76_EUMVA|nr:hypothetical protein EVAR_6571_1 [Eumeta japonica]
MFRILSLSTDSYINRKRCCNNLSTALVALPLGTGVSFDAATERARGQLLTERTRHRRARPAGGPSPRSECSVQWTNLCSSYKAESMASDNTMEPIHAWDTMKLPSEIRQRRKYGGGDKSIKQKPSCRRPLRRVIRAAQGPPAPGPSARGLHISQHSQHPDLSAIRTQNG